MNNTNTYGIEISTEISNSYLEYSMAAINRAIPDYRDGLIPSHRRIIWSAYKEGFLSSGSFKKCARLDGDVTGKYSPHGSAYGSIVTMASKWNNNFPLLDGHGNFGSSTDGPAASRYTECKLQKFTEDILLSEVDNLELKDNYDGSRKEPIYFNSRLPILLLKGQVSIAVGYATNIPQYNLQEISEYLISGPGSNKLLPDFPSGPEIFVGENPNNITQRAKINSKQTGVFGKRKKLEYTSIEFVNLPYGTNPEKIGGQIKSLVKKETFLLNDIIEINDLSDRNGDCIEIKILKSREREILETLYHHTDLQYSFSINFTVLVDGIPRTFTPEEYLDLWKKWRLEKIVEFYKLSLEKLEKDSLLLREIIKVLMDKSKIIEILDQDLSMPEIINQVERYYQISRPSIEFFLNLPIRKLANLETKKFQKDLDDAQIQIKKYLSIIENPLGFFKKEILDLNQKFGVERKSYYYSVPVPLIKESKSPAPFRSFSIDRKSGKIINGTEFSEPVILVGSNGKAYRVSANSRKGFICNEKFQVLFVLRESERESKSTLVIELLDEKSKLGKSVKVEHLTATSKGSPLGFNSITHAKLVKNSKFKTKGRVAKPSKYKND